MARRKQETLVLFPEVMSITRRFTDAQFGALMRAVFAYRFSGEVYSGEDLSIDVAFQTIANQNDRLREYSEINAKNAAGRESRRGEAECSEMQGNHPPIQSNPIQSSPIQSYPIQSDPIQSDPIRTDPIQTESIQTNPIQADPVQTEPVQADPGEDTPEAADKAPERRGFTPPSAKDVAAYCREKGYAVDAQRFVDYYISVGWKRGRTPVRDWRATVRTWARKDSPPEPDCGYILAPAEDPWETAMKRREAGRV